MIESLTRSTCALIITIVALVLLLAAVIGYVISQNNDDNDDNDDNAIIVSETPNVQGARIVASPTLIATGSTPFPVATSAGVQAAAPVQQPTTVIVAPAQDTTVQETTFITIDPNCTVRTDWTPYVVVAGDTMAGIAAVTGVTLTELAQGNCMSNPDLVYVGQTIVIPGGAVTPVAVVAATAVPTIIVQGTGGGCATTWFFIFTDPTATPAGCPGGINTVEAIAQDFQTGTVFWYASPLTSTEQRGIIYVVYANGTWESYPDTWNSALPASDPTITAPAGLLQPVNAIGKVWRENPNVRNALGWAVEQPIAFNGRFQNPSDAPTSTYLDNGESGVLWLNAGATGQNTWELAGSY